MEDKWQDLLAVAKKPGDTIKNWKDKTKGKVIGTLPIYVPEEIIHAAGALPVGLWGGDTEIELANAHLQGFACSIVRAVLEYSVKGTYDIVDGFVFPSTCDHMQNTSGIWRVNFPAKPKFDLVYPANKYSKAAPFYLLKLYNNFLKWVEEITASKSTEDKIRASIRIYNRHRELMGQLRTIRANHPQSMTGKEMASLVKAALFLPKEEYNSRLEELLPWLQRRKVKQKPKSRLVITGIMAEPDAIFEIIEELGGTVVADDLALGARLHRECVDEGQKPMEGLVGRHLSLGPCATIFDPEKKRGLLLENLCKETAADGVVFINMKFCEVEEFDYPIIKNQLEQAGIPLLFIEVEQQMSSFGQIRTRMQAFLEILA
jgi:bcr-type benzoyl-CoA reductase subunit C